ncbi:hypothetical protein DAI22_03g118700 [Oryza sativa Japonica Group]|nr:hypothetical protein DAI22_03g118700 [Oryza sativa Japonica Group]
MLIPLGNFGKVCAHFHLAGGNTLSSTKRACSRHFNVSAWKIAWCKCILFSGTTQPKLLLGGGGEGQGQNRKIRF